MPIEALPPELVIAAAIALCSGLIHGYTGFGTGPLMIPLFALLLGPVEAIAIAPREYFRRVALWLLLVIGAAVAVA